MIRSRNNRENISNERSPKAPCSKTIGTVKDNDRVVVVVAVVAVVVVVEGGRGRRACPRREGVAGGEIRWNRYGRKDATDAGRNAAAGSIIFLDDPVMDSSFDAE